jgi:hypothetical protein
MFSTPLLKRYRDAVVDKSLGPRLNKTVKELSKRGYTVGRKHYKRTPKGYDASHKNAEYLLFNGLAAMIEEDIPQAFYSPAIIDHAFSHYKNMHSLHQWLLDAVP